MPGLAITQWTRAAVLASASAIIFAGSLAADDNKPARASNPTPRAAAPATPRAAPSGGGGGHATPSAPSVGHATPSSVSRPTPSNPGQRNADHGDVRERRSGGSRPSGLGGVGDNGSRNNTNGGSGSGNNNRNQFPSAGSGRSGAGNPGAGNPGFGNHNPASSARPMGPSRAPVSTAHNVRNTLNGQQVALHNGRPSEIRSRDMMIRRGPSGMRRTVVERDGRTYSFNRVGNGHIRSGYSYGGRDYAVRHYYVAGVAYPRYYRSYGYRGVFFDAYTPARYYSPYYYGWAYNPWAAPVTFSWGWGRSPWYGYYGGYFTPYPSYTSANLWLTDYIVAQTLEASYRERAESARAAGLQYNDQPPQQQAMMTPEIKQMIAEEVQRQLSYEAAEAKSRVPVEPGTPPMAPPDTNYTGVGRMIDDNRTHALLSNTNIDVTTLSGQECSISQGDAVAIVPGQAGGQGETAQVKVLATTGAGNACPSNSVVTVSLQDLQEMVNHLRGTLDSGLGAMQKEANLPKPPKIVSTATVASEFAASAPPADPNEAAELARLNQEASSTEQDVVKDASFQDSSIKDTDSNGPLTQRPDSMPAQTTRADLEPGMTLAQVRAIKGAPSNPPTRFGAKEIWTYPDVKLTFLNGKLADVQ